MSLAHRPSQIFPFPNPNPNPSPRNLKPFDEALICRLTSLLNSSPSVSLPFLASAVDLLSSTLSAFSALLSDPNLSRSQPEVAALSSHLDASAALLDSVNSISASIDRLSRRRLHLAFALHLLNHRPLTPELTRKARDSVAEWSKAAPASSAAISASQLVRTEAPRGKISSVQRAIYAVEAVSALVTALVSSFLGEKADLKSIRVPSGFSWSPSFNAVLTAVGGKIGSLAAEIEAVDESVKDLTAAFDAVDKLGSVTKEAEKRTAELTVGLDRLGNAVNGLFRAGLCARNSALQGFRVGPKKCK